MRSFDFLTCYTLYRDTISFSRGEESILNLIQIINIPSLIDDTLNLVGSMNYSEKA